MRTISPALRDLGRVSSTGTLDYHGLLTKFQRRFADNFSVLAVVHVVPKSIDLNSDNDGNVTLSQSCTIPATTAARRTTTSRTRSAPAVIYELPFGRNQWYGGWQTSGIVYLPLRHPGDDHADAEPLRRPSTINQNRPNRIGDGPAGQSDD